MAEAGHGRAPSHPEQQSLPRDGQPKEHLTFLKSNLFFFPSHHLLPNGLANWRCREQAELNPRYRELGLQQEKPWSTPGGISDEMCPLCPNWERAIPRAAQSFSLISAGPGNLMVSA